MERRETKLLTSGKIVKLMRLSEKELEGIKELNNQVQPSRNYLLQNLCEVLSEDGEHDFYLHKILGGANSWVLIDEKADEENYLRIEVETYRFTSPTSYAIKCLIIYDHKERQYSHLFFDWYGNPISKRLTKKDEKEMYKNALNS